MAVPRPWLHGLWGCVRKYWRSLAWYTAIVVVCAILATLGVK